VFVTYGWGTAVAWQWYGCGIDVHGRGMAVAWPWHGRGMAVA